MGIDGKKLYIVHVKVGRGVEIRELTQQIELSMKRYTGCKAAGDNNYFKDIYKSLLSNNRIHNLTESNFLDFFKMDPIFVGLICIKKNGTYEDPLYTNIESCIAQYSILDLFRKINSLVWPISLSYVRPS